MRTTTPMIPRYLVLSLCSLIGRPLVPEMTYYVFESKVSNVLYFRSIFLSLFCFISLKILFASQQQSIIECSDKNKKKNSICGCHRPVIIPFNHFTTNPSFKTDSKTRILQRAHTSVKALWSPLIQSSLIQYQT